MAKTNTFSLYLARPNVKRLEELLSENASALLDKGKGDRTPSAEFGDGAVLFTFPGARYPPKWVELLTPTFAPPGNLFTQSPCALVAFKKGQSIFALTFAHAHVYLDDDKTEADFGLKVAVNAISDKNLKSVERSNIGVAIRDFAQAAGQRELRSFGFDDALDLIRKVTGRGADDSFANLISGARALRFSKNIALSEVPDAASEALQLFQSVAYKKTAFKIIDFLSPIDDFDIEARLDAALVEAIRDGSDEFEIAIPEIVPDRVASFRFENARLSRFHPDLSLELYRDGLGDRLAKLSLDDLKNHKVAAYADGDDRPFQIWSVHRSIVGSLPFQGERYALNEGSWYRVGKKIKEAADRRFDDLVSKADKKLRPLRKIIAPKEKGKRQTAGYQSEESYNREIANETGYLLLDQRLVQIDEKPGSGIEACDLLDIDGRRLIHVKKSSRQSSVLSHLFMQGGNAAQMLRKYEPFKSGLVETVKKHYGAKKAQELQAALDSKKRWTVEFQIADFPRKNGKHSIPFFSKLTLQDEARNIEAMEFDVQVGFITLSRIVHTDPNAKGPK